MVSILHANKIWNLPTTIWNYSSFNDYYRNWDTHSNNNPMNTGMMVIEKYEHPNYIYTHT